MEPGATSVKVDLGDPVFKDRKEPYTGVKTGIAPGIAKQMIIDAGLWSPGNGKQGKAKKNEELPKRSLCKRDFEGNDNQLTARVRSVASAIGDERARGRVGSLKLMVQGVDSFKKWWETVDNDTKIRLVADKKSIESLDPADITRFGNVVRECPFPGAVPTPAEEDQDPDIQEDDEEDEEPIKGSKRLPSRKK
jgi:hypothetical protein